MENLLNEDGMITVRPIMPRHKNLENYSEALLTSITQPHGKLINS